MEKESLFENSDNKLESALASIMTAEEYSKIEHSTPHVFELKSGDKELLYFGAPHTHDSNSSLFEKIESAFNKINPDVVFVEGVSVKGDKEVFEQQLKAASSEEVIKRMGEGGFALKLAVDNAIDWICPEPDEEDLYKELITRGFTKEQIFTWNVFRTLAQYNRLKDKQGFKEYVEKFIDDFKQKTGWENFDYSCDCAIQSGEEILNKQIDVENEPSASDFIDPIPWEEKKDKQTVLNTIGENFSSFRDKEIVKNIASAMKTNQRIFIVYGASHAVMQEPALKKLIE